MSTLQSWMESYAFVLSKKVSLTPQRIDVLKNTKFAFLNVNIVRFCEIPCFLQNKILSLRARCSNLPGSEWAKYLWIDCNIINTDLHIKNLKASGKRISREIFYEIHFAAEGKVYYNSRIIDLPHIHFIWYIFRRQIDWNP